MRHGVDRRVDDLLNRGVSPRRETVVHPQAVPPRSDEASLAEIGEVPRHLRLRQLQALVDVADADLARTEEGEDAESRRVGQRLEHTLEIGKRVRSHMCIDRYITPGLSLQIFGHPHIAGGAT